MKVTLKFFCMTLLLGVGLACLPACDVAQPTEPTPVTPPRPPPAPPPPPRTPSAYAFCFTTLREPPEGTFITGFLTENVLELFGEEPGLASEFETFLINRGYVRRRTNIFQTLCPTSNSHDDAEKGRRREIARARMLSHAVEEVNWPR